MSRKKPRQGKTSVSRAAIPAATIPKAKGFPSWARHVLVGATLAVAVLLAYSNSFQSGFVVDNQSLIMRDPRIRAVTADNISLIFHKSYWWPTLNGLYRPVVTLSYLFNYTVLGNADRPAGYHWINLVLHFMNVLLVYVLALRLLRKFWPAVFISALWAVHPVLTESVTNIAGRSDVLAALGVLAGLLMYLKSTDYVDWRRYAWLAGLMCATTVGVFSKESAVAILGVMVMYEIAFWKERKQLRGLLLGIGAAAIPIVVMLYLRIKVMSHTLATGFSFVDNPLQGSSFLHARLGAIAVMAKYMWLLVWPAKLSVDYSYAQVPAPAGNFHDWIDWLVVAAVATIIASQFWKNRLWFFFGTFAFIAFVPASNLLFLIGTIMGERFLYLPSVGFAVCAVIALYAICDRTRIRWLAPAALCVVVAAFAIRTWERNFDWKNDLTVAQSSVRAAPNSFKSHLSLALALNEGDPTHSRISEIIEEIDKSLAIIDSLPASESIPSIYATAGGDYRYKGDHLIRRGPDGNAIVPPESIAAYQKSLALLARGIAIDDVAQRLYAQQKAARGMTGSWITPAGTPLLYTNLAATNLRLGNLQPAYDAAVHARLLDPDVIESYVLMSQALAPQNRKEEAALALVEGVLVSGEQNLLKPLAVLYKYGVDPQGCALKQTPSGPLLNNECAAVHDEICHGSAELAELYRQDLRENRVDQTKSRAIGQFGCPADLFH